MRETNARTSFRPLAVTAGAGTALLLLGLGGYFLYLHAGALLEHGQALPPALMLALALIGGAASFFSPCSIAITPAFLAYLVAGETPGGEGRAASRSVFLAAVLVASGIVGFYAAAGGVVGMVGSVAYNYMIYLVPVVGLAFLALGSIMLLGATGRLAFVERWNPMNRRYARAEVGHPNAGTPGKRALVSFGFAYGAASHTCSLPIFLGILLVPLVAGNYALAALSVFVYGSAIALLVIIMMVLGQRVFSAFRRMGHWLMRATAMLFIGSGLFLFYYFGENYSVYATLAHAPSTAAASGDRYQLVEGAGPTGYPYVPRTLEIPARRTVHVVVTDHVGGCLLRTVFEGLGPGGDAVSVTVPVGESRVVALSAPHPGRYPFHCGSNMYSGTVVAR